MDFSIFISLLCLIGFCNAGRTFMEYAEIKALAKSEGQDQVKFSCAVDSGFEAVNSNNRANIIQRVAETGKGISIYFNGITSTMKPEAAIGWFRNSGSIICLVSWIEDCSKSCLKQIDERVLSIKAHLELAAFKSVELMSEISNKRTHGLDVSTQLKVIGSGFGAHAAGLFCQYIEAVFNMKVGMLFGLDPYDVLPLFPFLSSECRIRKGIADYVQIIRTSPIGLSSGNATIVVSSNCSKTSIERRHLLAVHMHEATATGAQTMVLTKLKHTHVEIFAGNSKTAHLEEYEFLIGIFNKNRISGDFDITVRVDETCETIFSNSSL